MARLDLRSSPADKPRVRERKVRKTRRAGYRTKAGRMGWVHTHTHTCLSAVAKRLRGAASALAEGYGRTLSLKAIA